jgi:hypothetical protein
LAAEIASAVAAVDEAVASFVDLIDDARCRSDADGSSALNTKRIQTEGLVQRIKQLRKDIGQLKASKALATESTGSVSKP